MERRQLDFARAIDLFGQKVHAVRPDQWVGATPCTGWSVRDLVNHVTYECLWAPDLMSGKTVAEVGDRYDGDNLGDDPTSAWDAASAEAVAAFAPEGALAVEVDSSGGPLAGSTYLDQLFLDVVIHGWDLARGIEVDDAIDGTFAEQLYAEVAPNEAELKTYGIYGDLVVPPDGAGTQTRLLAVLGRVQ